MINFKLIRRDGVLSGAKLENLKHFQKRQQLTDLVFICQDTLYHAHKLVLSSVSNTARKNLMSWDPSRSTIFMVDTHPHDVENIISFIYAGQIWLPKSEICGFLKAAAKLYIDCFEPCDELDIPMELLYKPKAGPMQDPCVNVNILNNSRINASKTYTLDMLSQNVPNVSISDQENSLTAHSSKDNNGHKNKMQSSNHSNHNRNHDNGLIGGNDVLIIPQSNPQSKQPSNVRLETGESVLCKSNSKSNRTHSLKSRSTSKSRPPPEKFRRLAFDSETNMDIDVRSDDENIHGRDNNDNPARLESSYVDRSFCLNRNSTPYFNLARQEFITRRVRGNQTQGVRRNASSTKRFLPKSAEHRNRGLLSDSDLLNVSEIPAPVLRTNQTGRKPMNLQPQSLPIRTTKQRASTASVKSPLISPSHLTPAAGKRLSPTIEDIISNIDGLPAKINTFLCYEDEEDGSSKLVVCNKNTLGLKKTISKRKTEDRKQPKLAVVNQHQLRSTTKQNIKTTRCSSTKANFPQLQPSCEASILKTPGKRCQHSRAAKVNALSAIRQLTTSVKGKPRKAVIPQGKSVPPTPVVATKSKSRETATSTRTVGQLPRRQCQSQRQNYRKSTRKTLACTRSRKTMNNKASASTEQ